MVNIVGRMRKLRARLLNVRTGPGAAILPPEVTKIHMHFAFKYNDGHMGPRAFWREHLPRLKYHNPTVHMTVHRTEDQTGPALMTVHFAENEATREETINMKHRHSSDILAQLLELTRAQAVPTSAEDVRLARELAEQRKISEEDAARCNAINAEARKKKQMLELARGQIAAEQVE